MQPVDETEETKDDEAKDSQPAKLADEAENLEPAKNATSTSSNFKKCPTNSPTRCAKTCATAQWDRHKERGTRRSPGRAPATARSIGPAIVATDISKEGLK